MKHIDKTLSLLLKIMILNMAHLKFHITISCPTSSDEILKMGVVSIFKMGKQENIQGKIYVSYYRVL